MTVIDILVEGIGLMQKRQLGQEGLEVSALGLGCMGMSWAYGSADEAGSIATIHQALDCGVNFFDTAEVYGPYENERLLGRALKGKREQAVIATKFGFKIDPSGQKTYGPITGVDSSPANVKKVAEESLQRLGTDYIDLFYQHRVDPNVPIEETVGAMAELVKEGKVRYLGLSEASVESIRKAHAVAPISALQSEYSLWERGVEQKIIPTLQELGIGLVPYCPLGRGFLTGEITRFEDLATDDYRRNDPRFQGENFNKNLKLVAVIKQLADKKGATSGQIALAWLLQQKQNIVPIPGTKRVKRLEENIEAVKITLSKEELGEIDSSLPQGIAAGPRYAQEALAMVNR